MKSQNTRGGKHHSFSGTSSSQGYSQNFAGQRKGSLKYGGSANTALPNSNANTSYPNSSASNSSAPPSTGLALADAHNALISLLANATGKSVIATVSSGARYRGVLLSVSLGLSGQDSLSIVLVKPTFVSRSLIDEKSNVDQKLPGKLVVEAKDLIDIEIAQTLVATPLTIDVNDKTPEPIPHAQTETTTETTVPVRNEVTQKLGEESQTGVSAKMTPKDSPKESPKNSPKESPKPMPQVAPKVSPKVSPKVTLGTSPKPANAFKNSPQSISAIKQDAAPKTAAKVSPGNTLSFKTDRDISSTTAGASFRERELQRWVPDADTPELVLEDTGRSNAKWDQFQVNQDKFGVESSYDEHLYTTKINTQATDYRERLHRAEKLAREIEGLTSSDRHILEERGVAVDDSGMDEEDKYSGVIQDSVVDNRGNELMAALRNVKISNAAEPVPSLMADGKYTTPRQRAAHYHNDPAIISSSATRKVQNEKPEDAVAQVTPQFQGQSQTQGQVMDEKKIPSHNQAQAPAQQGEAFRLNARSEFNALREFSANFKIPHKIPNDLLPILAKDKLKQDEILRKQESSKEKPEVVAGVSTNATGSEPKVASSANPATSKPAAALAASAPKKEGNRFKLNPKAAAFTPSKPQPMSPVPPKAGFQKPASNSPRVNNQRPFSNSSSGLSTGRRYHHQITAADFFGGADKVPTPESQKKKAELFKKSFNMFATAVRKHTEKDAEGAGPLVLEKAFWTPPTWELTVDETYAQLVAKNSAKPEFPMSPVPHPQFMASPIMPVPNGVPPMGPAYGGAPGGKFNMSPPVQQPMVQQFQQPFLPAMMYPQFQGGMPAGQPQVMYGHPAVDPLHFASGGYMMPGYMGNPAPINGASYNAMGPQSPGQNAAQHHGGRRYNQGKRGSAER